MGETGSHDCGEHQRTLENAQEEILHNNGVWWWWWPFVVIKVVLSANKYLVDKK